MVTEEKSTKCIKKPHKIPIGIVVCAVLLVILPGIFIFRNYDQKTSSYSQNATEKTENVMDAAPTPSAAEVHEPEPGDSGNPENGAVLYNRYADLNITMTIGNDTDRDCCIRLADAYGVAQILYVRARSQAEFASPQGTWTVQAATGDIWDNTENFFGPETQFYTMDEKLTFPWNTKQIIIISAGMSGFTADSDR